MKKEGGVGREMLPTLLYALSILGAAIPRCDGTHARPGSQLPRFEDYPVTDVFRGTPAQPVLADAEQREFRTRIREGVNKGYGVWEGTAGKDRPGPNFAGHTS